MDKNKSEDAKTLLEKEIDEINDCDKKERMKYFLSEYSKVILLSLVFKIIILSFVFLLLK